MGIFDWLKSLLVAGPPSLPSPFTWVSTYVFEHVIRPVGRSFQEVGSACKLAYSVIVDVWEHRDWWVNRAQLKFDSLWSRVVAKVAETAIAVLNQAYLNAGKLIAVIETRLGLAIDNVLKHLSLVSQAFSTFVVNLFTPWRNLVEGFRLWAKARLDEFDGWTGDVIRFWLALYHGYRVTLSALLPDPLAYILAALDTQLGRWTEWLRLRAARVLDLVW